MGPKTFKSSGSEAAYMQDSAAGVRLDKRDYAADVKIILSTSSGALDKLKALLNYSHLQYFTPTSGSTYGEMTAYSEFMAKAVASQLGHADGFGTPAFKSFAREERTRVLGIIEQGLNKDNVSRLLMGNEKEVTLIRNNALCEDKVAFLLELRTMCTHGPREEVAKLILGQLQYIDDHYAKDGAIRALDPYSMRYDSYDFKTRTYSSPSEYTSAVRQYLNETK